MPIIGVLNASAGGRWTPAKPNMSYNTTGKFNTTNYSSQNVYTLVPNSGTATMDGTGVVTLSATPSECTVAANSVKGTSQTITATALIGRAPYTFTYNCAMCASAFQDAQGNFVWVLQPYQCCSGPNLNAGPAGYVQGTNEWRRIVN